MRENEKVELIEGIRAAAEYAGARFTGSARADLRILFGGVPPRYVSAGHELPARDDGYYWSVWPHPDGGYEFRARLKGHIVEHGTVLYGRQLDCRADSLGAVIRAMRELIYSPHMEGPHSDRLLSRHFISVSSCGYGASKYSTSMWPRFEGPK